MISDCQLASLCTTLGIKRTLGFVVGEVAEDRVHCLIFLLVSRHLLFINMIQNVPFLHRDCIYLNSAEAFLQRHYGFSFVPYLSLGHRKHILIGRKRRISF